MADTSVHQGLHGCFTHGEGAGGVEHSMSKETPKVGE